MKETLHKKGWNFNDKFSPLLLYFCYNVVRNSKKKHSSRFIFHLYIRPTNKRTRTYARMKRTSFENKNGKTQSKILRTTEWIIKSIKYYHPTYTHTPNEEHFIILTNYTHKHTSSSTFRPDIPKAWQQNIGQRTP